jgi:hypothetical protein
MGQFVEGIDQRWRGYFNGYGPIRGPDSVGLDDFYIRPCETGGPTIHLNIGCREGWLPVYEAFNLARALDNVYAGIMEKAAVPTTIMQLRAANGKTKRLFASEVLLLDPTKAMVVNDEVWVEPRNTDVIIKDQDFDPRKWEIEFVPYQMKSEVSMTPKEAEFLAKLVEAHRQQAK